MEKKECWSCFGSGVVQKSWGRGYQGVCQECQGDGYIYTVGGKEVSKAEYAQVEAACYDDDDDD